MDSVGVNPHTHDQSNKVVTNKAKSLSPESIESSKNAIISLPRNNPHHTMCYQIPNIWRMLPQPIPPTGQ